MITLMPLFEMKPGELVAVPSSTFATEKVLERGDLQRLLRARIDAIAGDVLIVAEELGLHSRFRACLACPRVCPDHASRTVKDRMSNPLTLRSPHYSRSL